MDDKLQFCFNELLWKEDFLDKTTKPLLKSLYSDTDFMRYITDLRIALNGAEFSDASSKDYIGDRFWTDHIAESFYAVKKLEEYIQSKAESKGRPVTKKSVHISIYYDMWILDLNGELKKEAIVKVNKFLKKCRTYYLATVDNGCPRVRPFGTIDIYNGLLTIQTGKRKAVSQQLHANPNVEICAFNGEKWLRISATAVELDELAAQIHMLEAYPELTHIYKAGDGNTEIFALTDATATFSSFTEEQKVYKL